MNLLLDSHAFLWFIDGSTKLSPQARELIEDQGNAKVISLPFHHRDPFDRLLVAQCLAEELSVLSVDPAFDKYSVCRLW